MAKSRQEGFTILEIALVLAIAAAIFLVAFLAVPAMQRNQRDDARRRDVADVVQAVITSIANRNAPLVIPLTSANGFAYENNTPVTGSADVSKLGSYLDSMSNNIDSVKVWKGGDGEFPTSSSISRPNNGLNMAPLPLINEIAVFVGASCVGNRGITTAAKNYVAVAVQLENGGGKQYYCQGTGPNVENWPSGTIVNCFFARCVN